VLQRRISRNILTAGSQRDNQFRLKMQVVCPRRIGHALPIGQQCIRRLREEEWRLAFRVVAEFASMLGIVAADAPDTPHWEARGFSCHGKRRLCGW